MQKKIRTYIDINALRVYAYHGVDAQETRVGNWFEVSVRVYFDASAAMLSDDLNQTVNYAMLVDIIKYEMARPANLLEHVTENIRRSIITNCHEVDGGIITVSKCHPPLGCQIGSTSFTIEW